MRDLDKQDFPVTKKLLKDKQPISVPPLYKAFSLSLFQRGCSKPIDSHEGPTTFPKQHSVALHFL